MATASPTSDKTPAIEIHNLDFHYGARQVLEDINLRIPHHTVTALIGPSGSGKSTLLHCLNRMNESVPQARITRGFIRIEGQDIHHRNVDPIILRRHVGMVFQKPNPFPTTIRENILYGLRLRGVSDLQTLHQTLVRSLRDTGLWKEVKDRLDEPAQSLSAGQQQRLCIARTLANDPSIILMDEPCSVLDPTATAKIEELIHHLRDQFTIVIVTHIMQQAARISGHAAFFHRGKLVESGETSSIFTHPAKKETEDYITGRYG